MHAEAAGRFGNVELGVDKRLVNTLPFEILDRCRPGSQRNGRIAINLVESGDDIVRV
ncbi:hypothetical protein D3C71_2097420 [compost metagenome]